MISDAFFEQAFDLSGQVALVTGGGSGLGYATAKCLAAAGAKVVITGRREEVLAKACQELGDRVCYYVHDVTDTDAAPTFIARVVDEQGGCDILRQSKRAIQVDIHHIPEILHRDLLHRLFAVASRIVPPPAEDSGAHPDGKLRQAGGYWLGRGLPLFQCGQLCQRHVPDCGRWLRDRVLSAAVVLGSSLLLTGDNRVDPDAVSGNISGHAAGQAHQCGFRRPVNTDPGHPEQRGHRRKNAVNP